MRKRKRKTRKAIGTPKKAPGCAVTPTIIEQLEPILYALNEEMGGKSASGVPKPKLELPIWCRNITKRLCKTVLQPVIKLRPSGQVDWRNYGRAIGVLERAIAFYKHDVPRIIKDEFSDLTAEDWKRIEPSLGLHKLRAKLVKTLNRPVADHEPLEKLADEALDRMLAGFQPHRETALHHLAGQSPKVAALFYKGMSEGYRLFLDESGKLCGDRGRANIHLNLLACMLDVEKIRRTFPPTTRSQYYDQLTAVFKLPPKAYDWFNDICDDIKLPLNNLGRKRRCGSPAG
jgi:hypothetical protein